MEFEPPSGPRAWMPLSSISMMVTCLCAVRAVKNTKSPAATAKGRPTQDLGAAKSGGSPVNTDQRWRGHSPPATDRADSGSGSTGSPKMSLGIQPVCRGTLGRGGGELIEERVRNRRHGQDGGSAALLVHAGRAAPLRRAERWRTAAAWRWRSRRTSAAAPVDDIDMGVDLEQPGGRVGLAAGSECR